MDAMIRSRVTALRNLLAARRRTGSHPRSRDLARSQHVTGGLLRDTLAGGAWPIARRARCGGDSGAAARASRLAEEVGENKAVLDLGAVGGVEQTSVR